MLGSMFNVKHQVDAVLDWLGETMTAVAVEKLDRFGRWLATEAIAGGGLGPREGERIDERHLADSLAFARGLPTASSSVLDVGTGAGLPGIPLSLLRPESYFVLLDRSGRKVDLVSRAVRVLELENVSVMQADVSGWQEVHDGLVMRAALPLERAYPLVRRLLEHEGVAVFGLSRREDVVAPGTDSPVMQAEAFRLTATLVSVPVLDSPATLLRITRNDEFS